MKKIFLIFFTGLILAPVLMDASYYNWNKEEVEELPTASKDTLDKVYVVNDKYYITSYTKGETTSILNTNLSGKTIYFNFPETDEFKSYFETSQWINYYVYDTINNARIELRKVNNSSNVICVYTNELGFCNTIYNYDNGLINDSFTFGTDTDIIFDNLYDSKLDWLSEYISLTPFNDTFEWVEVPEDEVYFYLDTKVYVPDLGYSCYVVTGSETIRAYKTTPTLNSTISYRDYYVNSHYLFKDGTTTFSSYSSSLPTCIDSSLVTNQFIYRNDFVDIVVIFTCVVFICYFIIKKIVRVFFLGYKWS